MRDLSLHLMDIIQNSISALCTKITVSVNAEKIKGFLEIEVVDNGIGMDKEMAENVINPFVTSRKTRKVGLGIPLLVDSAKMAGGDVAIDSKKNFGTSLKASFKIDHIDRIPLGDLAETIVMIIMANPEIELELQLNNDNQNFRFNSFEIRRKLGEVPITSFEVITWIKGYIDDGIKLIFGGVLNEVNS